MKWENKMHSFISTAYLHLCASTKHWENRAPGGKGNLTPFCVFWLSLPMLGRSHSWSYHVIWAKIASRLKKTQLYFRLKSLLMVNWYSQIPSQNRDCRQAAHFQSKPFFRQTWPEQLIKMYLKFSDFTVWYQFNIGEQGTMGPLLGRALIIFRSPRRTKVWPNFSSVFHPWVIQFQKQFLVPPSSYLKSQLCSCSSSTC